MNIEQPLEKMTWGELRAFVALSSADDAEEVVFDYDEQLCPQSMFITSVDLKQVVRCEHGCRNDAEEG